MIAISACQLRSCWHALVIGGSSNPYGQSGSDLDVKSKAAKPHTSKHRCERHWRTMERPLHLGLRRRDRGRAGRLTCGCHHVWARRIVAGRSGLGFLPRIGNPAMQHRHQGKTKTLGDNPNITQSQIALGELPITNTLINNIVDQLLDFRRRRFLQTA